MIRVGRKMPADSAATVLRPPEAAYDRDRQTLRLWDRSVAHEDAATR
jgi:hypothetical protein